MAKYGDSFWEEEARWLAGHLNVLGLWEGRQVKSKEWRNDPFLNRREVAV